jgi:hypothetical protein
MALTPDAQARLRSAVGGKTVTVDMVQAAADAGAPVGIGQRVNLVECAAWLEGACPNVSIDLRQLRPGKRGSC